MTYKALKKEIPIPSLGSTLLFDLSLSTDGFWTEDGKPKNYITKRIVGIDIVERDDIKSIQIIFLWINLIFVVFDNKKKTKVD